MIRSVMIVLKHFNFGGTERYAVSLAEALTRLNISVIIVAGQGPYAAHVNSKIKVFFAPISRSGKNNKISQKIIYDIAGKYKPQIIHAQCRNSLLCCQLARKVFKIPTVSHEHLAYKDLEYVFVANELNLNCDRVITISHHVANKLILNGLEQKVTTVFNGIDLKHYPPITKKEKTAARKEFGFTVLDKVILCLSRIVPGKNMDNLVEAFRLVQKEVDGARLIIAGDDEWGSTKTMLQNQIIKNKLSRKILLYPAQFDIRKFHAAANVFCHPAVNKGLAVMEAMTSELPIVAKESLIKPAVAEHNIHGLLTQTYDVAELASQLIRLLKNNILAAKMGRAARRKIKEKYDLEKTVKKILKIYQQTIAAA